MDMRCTSQVIEQVTQLAAGDPAAGMAEMLREWLGSEGDEPSLLERNYPHVIRRIEALWGSEGIHPFLDALTPPEGTPCQGFPPEVAAEIQRFRSAYRSLYPAPVPPEPAPEPVPIEATPEPLPAPDIQLDDDYDIWKSERQRRGWSERSIF